MIYVLWKYLCADVVEACPEVVSGFIVLYKSYKGPYYIAVIRYTLIKYI